MTAVDLTRAIARSEAIAASLQRSRSRLAPLFPLDAARVAALTEEQREALDALLKRFENLVNHLQDQVFRLVADHARVGDTAALSRRDVLDYLEKIGALDSADAVLDAARARNRLAHVYPDEPDRQAGQLNRAFATSQAALDAVGSARAWAEREGLLPPP
ncbi:MAG: hypothetical protein K2X74_11135 [Acetobacteraceae bacterium]|nr:hypothetical protein [Acetobacteraceae bacterium]